MTRKMMNPRYVLTGGPGAGKTTVLNALAERGYRVVPESARRIIKERLRKGLPRRPAPAVFANEILQTDIEQYRRFHSSQEPVFYDRGVPDALYMLDTAAALPGDTAAGYVRDFPYNNVVFLLPPWARIYATDAERDQTIEEAQGVFEGMKQWYSSWGYETVEVPRLDVISRAAFILETVDRTMATPAVDAPNSGG